MLFPLSRSFALFEVNISYLIWLCVRFVPFRSLQLFRLAKYLTAFPIDFTAL